MYINVKYRIALALTSWLGLPPGSSNDEDVVQNFDPMSYRDIGSAL